MVLTENESNKFELNYRSTPRKLRDNVSNFQHLSFNKWPIQFAMIEALISFYAGCDNAFYFLYRMIRIVKCVFLDIDTRFHTVTLLGNNNNKTQPNMCGKPGHEVCDDMSRGTFSACMDSLMRLHKSYRQIPNTRRTKSDNWNVSRLEMQLYWHNQLKPGLELRMKM